MADEFFTQNPPPITPAGRNGVRARVVLGSILIAFLLGGAVVGYAVWDGLIPAHRAESAPAVAPAASAPAIAPRKLDPGLLAAQQDELEARVATLAGRLDQLGRQASAASGNAARSEALLIAFAARRALDRGEPLNYLEDQLRLRFGNSQPNAVSAVIAAGRQPVTLDQLVAGLDALAPDLTQAPPSEGAWARIKREAASLFVIRHDTTPSPAPQVMLGRARVMVEEGRTEDAIAEVRRLPGAREANAWIDAAQRYDTARRALDVLETAAILEPQGLRDASGAAVTTPSPIGPAPEATAGA